MNNTTKVLGLLLALAFAAAQAQAADIYKVNNTGNLNNVTSWSTTSGAQTPNPAALTTADNWYFNQATMTAGTKTVSLGDDMTIAGMALDWSGTDPGSGNYSSLVINSGNTLTLNGGTLGGLGVAGSNYTATGILLNRGTGGTITINANIALGANQSWVTGRSSGTPLTINGNVAAGGYTLLLNMVSSSSVVNTINGAITGTAKITKQREATLVLNGDNSGHSGGFQLGADAGATNVGVVRVGHNNALGTGAVTVRGTQLQAGTTGITLANTFNVGAGGFRLGGTNDFTISGAINLDNAQRSFANYGTATVTLGGTTTLGGTASRVSFDSGGNFIVNGNITGTGSTTPATGALLVSAGNATFNGTNNNYTGQTNITGGTISGTGTISSSLINMSGGSIRLAGGATTTSLTFGAGATFTNSPTVVFQSAPVQSTVYDIFSYTGTLTGLTNLKVAAHGTTNDTGSKYTFTAGEYGANRTWNTTTGTWDNLGTNANWLEGDQKFYDGDTAVFGDIASDSVITLSGTISPNGVTVQNSANKYTFQTGVIGGTTSLVKNNAGTLIIANNQSYTGGTTVNGGTLRLQGGGSTGTIRGTLTANSGTTIEIGGNDSLGYSTGADAVRTINLNSATLVQTQNRNETNTAVINMAGGSTISATGGTSALFDMFGGTAALNASGDTTNTISSPIRLRQDNTAFTVADGAAATDLLVSGVISKGTEGNGALVKAGAGRMVLTASNTYTGNTTINGGVLELSTTGKLYNGGYQGSAIVTVNAGGTWRMPDYSYGGVGQLADQAARRVLNGGTIEVTGGTHTSGQDFTVGTNGGTFRYNPANTANTLTLVGNNNSNTTLNGALTFDTVGNITIDDPADDNSGVLAGAGGITKTGAGTLRLNAANTYIGPTTVAAGILAVDGSIASSSLTTVDSGATLQGTGTVGPALVNANGHIAPGNSIGTLSVNGNLTISGTLDVEYDGGGSLIDLLAVTGNLNIGSATVDFAPLNSSLTGSPYIFATYGSLIGSQFASVVDLPGGYTIDYAYDNGTTTTNIALIPEPTAALLVGLGLLGLLRRRRA